VWALKLLGALAAYRYPPDYQEAERCYKEALTLAEELGMRPVTGHCHFGLGELYLQSSDLEHASIELANAIEIYRSMDMVFWLARAEAYRSNLQN
jgi:tetratricopeptide (TPR) repeat protein